MNKIADAETLSDRLAGLDRPIVFTNGCFDILHRGHVAYLQQAARLGKSLVVGVNSDTSIRSLDKGSDRPINPLPDRLAVLSALEAVDLVIAFDEDTPLNLIRRVKPDHLVKGGDWIPENIVGADFVKASGGEVHSIPVEFNRSTTALIERIRSMARDRSRQL
ncbi:D-glycero-beta-D-manno-heptose 1-phosphate adenylyltransferase [Pseudomonadota bacterium]